MKPVMQKIKPYLLATALALSIWVAAILINTVFVMCWMGFSKSGGFDIDIAGFIIYSSGIFSSPGLLIVWLVCIVKFRSNNLFNIIFIAAFIGSFLSSFTLAALLQEEIGQLSIMLFISPIAIALLSVLMHKPFIKLITYKYNEEPCIEAL
jgi:hypothetical protein